MGNCYISEEDDRAWWKISKQEFDYKYAIGRGGFGKVWRVSSNRLKQEKLNQFAMKEMLKARVMHKKSI